jgi:hypothetical protein
MQIRIRQTNFQEFALCIAKERGHIIANRLTLTPNAIGDCRHSVEQVASADRSRYDIDRTH